MAVTHYLISEPTGLSAAEIERRTGMRAIDTPLGVMLEKPKPLDMRGALAEIDRALHPTRCICGPFAIIHRSNCPEWACVT